MRHNEPLGTLPELTHDQMCEAIETARRMRAEAMHDYSVALFRRLRSLFTRQPGVATGAQQHKRAPDWCVARDLGARSAGMAS